MSESDCTHSAAALQPDEAAIGEGGESDTLELDYARCAEITRRASSNFYYAFMLLPAERRRALHAIYAFCRFVDDIAVDENVTEPVEMIAQRRAEIAIAFVCTPTRH